MSDSLRDQLLKAGFKDSQTEKPPRQQEKRSGSKKKKKPETGSRRLTASSNAQALAEAAATEEAAEKARRKAIKQQITELINTHSVKDFKGDIAFAFQLGTRVRQLFVTDEVRQRLAARELVITRLNGNTVLVPPDIGEQMLALNPNWAVLNRDIDESTDLDEDGDHPVPDDLIW